MVQSKRIPTVAIVGRTNVGKSTLFNAFLGRRVSIVEDTPGVTRDRHYALIKRFEFPFTVIDTGGLVGEEGTGLEDQVRNQAEIAIEEADLVICLFDGIDGIHPQDSDVVDILRRSGKPVLWTVNKCEKPLTQTYAAEYYQLGIDEIHFVSAAHQVGVTELAESIGEALEINPEEIPDPEKTEETIIKVAILGKPNVGKSSLINRILGEERLVTSDIAGTTRDSIDAFLTRDGQKFQIVDTAGLRKKANVDHESVERYSNLHALKSLASCDVAVLVIDGSQGLPTEQDTKVAALVHERGRGFIIVVNKWDDVEKDHRTVKAFEEGIRGIMKFTPYAPILFVSALTGRRCPSILQKVKEVYLSSTTRIKTGPLNKVLGRAFEIKPPPVYRGAPVKMFFATQVSVAPPEIVVFLNHPDKLGFSYERYIKNSLRKEFPFEGTDIKIIFKRKKESEVRKLQASR